MWTGTPVVDATDSSSTQQFEIYTRDGQRVLSNLAYFRPGDTGITLYPDSGSAQF